MRTWFTVMVVMLGGCASSVGEKQQQIELIDDDPGDPGGTGEEIVWTSVDRATAEAATMRSLQQYAAYYGDVDSLVSARCAWQGVAPGDSGNISGTTVRWRWLCRVTGYQCYFWEGGGIRDISCSRTYGGWYAVDPHAVDDDPGDPGGDGTGEEFVWSTDVPQAMAEIEAQAAVEFLHADSLGLDATSYRICRWRYTWLGELQLQCALGYARCTWTPTRFGLGDVLCSWAPDYRDPRIDPVVDDAPNAGASVAPSMIDDDPGDEEGTPWTLVQSNVDPSQAEEATAAWAAVTDGMAARGCAWDGDLYVCRGYRSVCVFFLSVFAIRCKAV